MVALAKKNVKSLPQRRNTLTIQHYNILHRILNSMAIEKISTAELAKETRLSVTTIHNLRNLKTRYPGFQTICLIADALGIHDISGDTTDRPLKVYQEKKTKGKISGKPELRIVG